MLDSFKTRLQLTIQFWSVVQTTSQNHPTAPRIVPRQLGAGAPVLRATGAAEGRDHGAPRGGQGLRQNGLEGLAFPWGKKPLEKKDLVKRIKNIWLFGKKHGILVKCWYFLEMLDQKKISKLMVAVMDVFFERLE